jgi:hypothetical protein
MIPWVSHESLTSPDSCQQLTSSERKPHQDLVILKFEGFTYISPILLSIDVLTAFVPVYGYDQGCSVSKG